MKPFNLKEARAGKPVCTRDGAKARIVCFNVQGNTPPLMALITGPDGGEYMSSHHANGTSAHGHDKDLFMDAVKCEGWATVYKRSDGCVVIGSRMYPSYEIALEDSLPVGRLTIAHIEWEE